MIVVMSKRFKMNTMVNNSTNYEIYAEIHFSLAKINITAEIDNLLRFICQKLIVTVKFGVLYFKDMNVHDEENSSRPIVMKG